MEANYIVVRFGELTTKGKNRKLFTQKLLKNTKEILFEFPQLQYQLQYDRLYIYLNGANHLLVNEKLKTVFGIHSFSNAYKFKKDLAFGRLRGCAYAVDSGAESSADAAAFHAAFEAVQKDVREKHPSTLTADAALLLAKLSDAELAPLEAVAEDVGVDPAPYYTTRTLGEAFLAKCDFERLRSFEPLFKGEAGPAQAARAALLPNTFLQALVCRALTGRVPPEEMET